MIRPDDIDLPATVPIDITALLREQLGTDPAGTTQDET